MKTISKWSYVGIAFGFLFTVANATRYYLLWPDMDKAIAYSLIGILIMGVSFLYAMLLDHSNTITAIEDHLAAQNEAKVDKSG